MAPSSWAPRSVRRWAGKQRWEGKGSSPCELVFCEICFFASQLWILQLLRINHHYPVKMDSIVKLMQNSSTSLSQTPLTWQEKTEILKHCGIFLMKVAFYKANFRNRRWHVYPAVILIWYNYMLALFKYSLIWPQHHVAVHSVQSFREFEQFCCGFEVIPDLSGTKWEGLYS